MKKQINILNDTILSLGSKAVGMILFMATDIMIARFLSTESYDEWSFFYAIITMCYWLVTLAEFGGYFIFGVGCLVISKNIIGLGIGYIIAIWNAALIGSILLKKYLRESKCQYADSEYEKTIRWSIFKYAMPIFVVSIGSLLLTEMDSLMLGVMSETGEIGAYSIAKSLICLEMLRLCC